MITKHLCCTLLGLAATVAGSALAAAPAKSATFAVGSYVSADLTVTFEANGHFHVKQGDATKVEGTYTVTADQLRVTDTGGPWACADNGTQSGTYRWQAANGTLTFSALADTCKNRRDSITAHPWTQQH